MVSTRWFNRDVSNDTERAFLKGAFLSFFPRYLKTFLRMRRVRTPATVRSLYDADRGSELDRFRKDPWDFETFVYGPAHDQDFILVDDRITFGPLRAARTNVMNEIEVTLKPFLLNPHGAIVEFGSGFGRNLLLLKKKYPAVRLVGLELSPASVEFSRAAAAHYGLDVEFLHADACETISGLPADTAVCFSVHALEQMPRIFGGAVSNMLAAASQAVFFFEPVCELYPANLRGMVSKWRARCMDRLKGLQKHLIQRRCAIKSMRRLGCGDNPLNETCMIAVESPRASS